MLRGQLTTVSEPEDPSESAVFSRDHLGGRSAGSSGRGARKRELELATRLGELTKRRDALAPKEVFARYKLDAEIAALLRG